MEWVDSRLREDGTSIPGRPSRAMSILAVELREPFVTPYPERALLEGCYTGDDLTMRVEEWFDRRYGERLKIDMSPGRAVILIRNDPWVLKLPLIVGTWEIVTEDPPRDPPDNFARITNPGAPPNKHNCLRSIVDMPDALRSSLRPRERGEILLLFEMCFEVFHGLNDLRESRLVIQSLASIDAAVDHLLGARRNPPLAKWASLQTAEKMLKEYIRAKGARFKHAHDLEVLANHAESLGLPHVGRTQLAEIQCAAGVRYGDVAVSVSEAVQAHLASIAVAGHVARALGAIPPRH
jgi:hypothetical protein